MDHLGTDRNIKSSSNPAEVSQLHSGSFNVQEVQSLKKSLEGDEDLCNRIFNGLTNHVKEIESYVQQITDSQLGEAFINACKVNLI